MTERELDRIMRRVLIDSLKTDTERAGKEPGPSFEPTSGYKRRMRAMVANPAAWLRRREHPRRQAVWRAAVILLACLAAFGGTMAFHPTARAAVIRWIMERYEGGVDYRYAGEQNPEALPQYGIAELPDGYAETVRDTAPGLVAVTYENREGDVIYLDYIFMHQGAQTSFVLNGDEVFDVTVNQMNGQFIQSHIPGNLNSLTWIDPDLNIQFTLDGNFGLEELLYMAEKISLCEVTK